MKMNKDKKVITIDRAKWRTGDDHGPNITGYGQTELLNKEGFKCCLGFLCQQVSKKKVKGRLTPSDMGCSIPELNELRYVCRYNSDDKYFDTVLSNKAMNINDDEDTDPKEKERLLKELFKDTRYKLVFKGKYTRPKDECREGDQDT